MSSDRAAEFLLQKTMLALAGRGHGAWIRPAKDFTVMIFIRIFPNKIHAL